MIKAIAVAVGGEAKTVASVLLSLFIHRFSFGNILFDLSARRGFCTSRMGRLRSCLFFDLFHRFGFLAP